ncbi:MAG: metalloregulator ArsR/SmtB family transcription factor [Kofleriaceae bacterium]
MPSADLSLVFAALADPTRRAILARLSTGEAPVKELAEPFELSGPAITKHLKVLERAGLISRSRDGQQRPCRLEARALEPAADWIAHYRQLWEEQLDRLGDYLKSVLPHPPRAELPSQGAPAAAPKKRAKAAKQPSKIPARRRRHGDKK